MKLEKISLLCMALATVCCFSSCEKENNEPTGPDADKPTVSQGLYVLNQGNSYAGIDGSFNVIDYNNDESYRNVFKEVNKRQLGATPQCGVAYGSKIYIGVYESNTIEILNRDTYKSAKQILLSDSKSNGSQPRCMVANGGKVYISMFDGYVARLDTLTMEIEASVKVGPNPENMAILNGKLYVPNSDGLTMTGKYGTTASIIDLSSFEVTGTFEVPENPSAFYTDGRSLYLLAVGNYGDVASKLFKINDDLSYEYIDDATIACICGNYLCYVNDPFYGSGQAEYKKYELSTGEITGWDIERPEYASSIYYDKLAGKIAISSLRFYGGIWPSYEKPGYIAVYDMTGRHLNDYEVGVGPACIFSNAE